MFPRLLVAAIAVLALVAAVSTACASSSTKVSPCRQVYSDPVWSPDGKQIAYYGRRWPRSGGHGNPNSVLQALCTMNADGTNVQSLRYTVCSENCPDPPGQLAWFPTGLVYLRDGVIYRIVPGSKPVKVMTFHGESFSADVAGDRIATGQWSGCVHCPGPVTVYSLVTGRRVGTVGGKKLYNVNPSLSPDGSRVVLERDATGDSGKLFGIWTADVDGSHLHRLVRAGQQPSWSPAGGTIAYARAANSNWPAALRLVKAGGGKSRVLVPKNVLDVFGWSPDGKYVAFESGTGTPARLAVVDVATGKVRTLLPPQYAQIAAWSPDSRELVVNIVQKKCWSTWRVPVGGAKPSLISSCK